MAFVSFLTSCDLDLDSLMSMVIRACSSLDSNLMDKSNYPVKFCHNDVHEGKLDVDGVHRTS